MDIQSPLKICLWHQKLFEGGGGIHTEIQKKKTQNKKKKPPPLKYFGAPFFFPIPPPPPQKFKDAGFVFFGSMEGLTYVQGVAVIFPE